MKIRYSVINCTCPDIQTVNKITSALLNEKLIACANIIPNVSSVYWWKNKIETQNEILIIMKTRASLFNRIKKIILSLHHYEVPEIISLPFSEGNKKYLKWIDENTIK